MYSFMHLNVHIPDFLMKPFVLCFSSGCCRVYIYRGHFGFADVYSRLQISNKPFSPAEIILHFNTMFLNIDETKCQKKKFCCN